MNTAFATGPGFFMANTNRVEPSLADGVMRVYCVRIEAYDLGKSQLDLETRFTVFAALAENNPVVARALLSLGKAVEQNKSYIEEQARR